MPSVRRAVLAPPLITHWEVPEGGRATQYVGEKRMGVFGELAGIEAEVLAHSQAEHVLPVFTGFCKDLFDWMSGGLCEGGDAEAQEWRLRYAEAADEFWQASQAAGSTGKGAA